DRAVTTVAGKLGDPFAVTLALDGDGLITGLLFGPVGEPRPEATSLAEVEERFLAIPAGSSLLVERSTADTVETLIDVGSERSAPLASVFKLFVLGAVIHQIEAGALA